MSVYYFPTEEEDDEDGPTMKEKMVEAALKGIETFCVWDCCWCWLKLQEWIAWIVFDPFVELFITLCIVINTLFMALDHHNMNREIEKVLKAGNYVRLSTPDEFWFCQYFFVSILSTIHLFVLVFHCNIRHWSIDETLCNESKILFSRRLEHFWFHNCSVVITWIRLRRRTRFICITFV